jgi:hypothetical protein
VRPRNPWDLKGCRQKQGEPLWDYIWCFSQKYHELPSVANADVISTFWDNTMCHSLVHELDNEQPKTTKELCNIATRHASGEEVVGSTFTLVNTGTTVGGGQAIPTNVTVRSTKMGAKGRKKGQKHRSHYLATVTNNDGVGEEIEDSDKEFVATTEHDFKRRTRPPKDHFEKILEVVCPHHPYPIKHKLRDCTMMKRFMTLGVPHGGDEPTRDTRGRGMTLVPIEVEVVTIIG